ncbi:hypothetical protein BJ508DRAFT_335875 [Ascobolus immersus RN42]|uniref:Uncharacterized protein n=1 Tax=Ascobolus immersus RN42 TaxID=1160509 RepID=A0A3N4HHV7_ASCIM|nr:hypothetical protein BJ508DRAFT_335875 [Ascobolus immersus RN42]
MGCSSFITRRRSNPAAFQRPKPGQLTQIPRPFLSNFETDTNASTAFRRSHSQRSDSEEESSISPPPKRSKTSRHAPHQPTHHNQRTGRTIASLSPQPMPPPFRRMPRGEQTKHLVLAHLQKTVPKMTYDDVTSNTIRAEKAGYRWVTTERFRFLMDQRPDRLGNRKSFANYTIAEYDLLEKALRKGWLRAVPIGEDVGEQDASASSGESSTGSDDSSDDSTSDEESEDQRETLPERKRKRSTRPRALWRDHALACRTKLHSHLKRVLPGITLEEVQISDKGSVANGYRWLTSHGFTLPRETKPNGTTCSRSLSNVTMKDAEEIVRALRKGWLWAELLYETATDEESESQEEKHQQAISVRETDVEQEEQLEESITLSTTRRPAENGTQLSSRSTSKTRTSYERGLLARGMATKQLLLDHLRKELPTLTLDIQDVTLSPNATHAYYWIFKGYEVPLQASSWKRKGILGFLRTEHVEVEEALRSGKIRAVLKDLYYQGPQPGFETPVNTQPYTGQFRATTPWEPNKSVFRPITYGGLGAPSQTNYDVSLHEQPPWQSNPSTTDSPGQFGSESASQFNPGFEQAFTGANQVQSNNPLGPYRQTPGLPASTPSVQRQMQSAFQQGHLQARTQPSTIPQSNINPYALPQPAQPQQQSLYSHPQRDHNTYARPGQAQQGSLFPSNQHWPGAYQQPLPGQAGAGQQMGPSQYGQYKSGQHDARGIQQAPLFPPAHGQIQPPWQAPPATQPVRSHDGQYDLAPKTIHPPHGAPYQPPPRLPQTYQQANQTISTQGYNQEPFHGHNNYNTSSNRQLQQQGGFAGYSTHNPNATGNQMQLQSRTGLHHSQQHASGFPATTTAQDRVEPAAIPLANIRSRPGETLPVGQQLPPRIVPAIAVAPAEAPATAFQQGTEGAEGTEHREAVIGQATPPPQAVAAGGIEPGIAPNQGTPGGIGQENFPPPDNDAQQAAEGALEDAGPGEIDPENVPPPDNGAQEAAEGALEDAGPAGSAAAEDLGQQGAPAANQPRGRRRRTQNTFVEEHLKAAVMFDFNAAFPQPAPVRIMDWTFADFTFGTRA